ncbi:MAG: TIGR02206 family membrane protein [Phycisphaerales bacterium]
MTPATVHVLAQAAAKRNPHDWVNEFVSFSLFHLLTVCVFGTAMLAACKYGRMCGETPREARFRRGWGWLVIVYQSYYTFGYLFPKTLFFPSKFSWEESLPLQVCDLAAFVAGAAMVWQTRWLRALLYFWGIGLSTQAFFTPTLRTGLGSAHYWMFWIGHTMIVGSAVYDIVVRRFRPTARDLGITTLISLAYLAVAFGTNFLLDRSGLLAPGVVSNYGYIGNTRPENPTLIDDLGPWPGRVFILVAIVLADFVLLWGIWRVAALFRRKPAPRPATQPDEPR